MLISLKALRRDRGGLQFLGSFMRAIFYIDGFNLYRSRLKRNRGYRWLNLLTLARRLVADEETVARVNFYTAYVSGRVDADAVGKQQAYLAALKTVPEIHIESGNFVISDRWVRLVHPPAARPDGCPWPEPHPHFVRASIPQEKGSDVKLGVHLVRDSFQDAYDVAYVLTNDSDLEEPIRIATQELEKRVVIVPPILPRSPQTPVPAPSLRRVASDVCFIHDEDLLEAQFPDEVVRERRSTLIRPPGWSLTRSDD